jgi:hypothetical protein
LFAIKLCSFYRHRVGVRQASLLKNLVSPKPIYAPLKEKQRHLKLAVKHVKGTHTSKKIPMFFVATTTSPIFF